MYLEMSLDLECSLCRENDINSPETKSFDVIFHGIANKYNMCPNCKQEVSKDTQNNKNYRKRWTRFVNKSKDINNG
jgi:hypothetical protein